MFMQRLEFLTKTVSALRAAVDAICELHGHISCHDNDRSGLDYVEHALRVGDMALNVLVQQHPMSPDELQALARVGGGIAPGYSHVTSEAAGYHLAKCPDRGVWLFLPETRTTAMEINLASRGLLSIEMPPCASTRKELGLGDRRIATLWRLTPLAMCILEARSRS